MKAKHMIYSIEKDSSEIPREKGDVYEDIDAVRHVEYWVPRRKFNIDYLISNIMANPPNMWSVPYTFVNINIKLIVKLIGYYKKCTVSFTYLEGWP